MRHAQSTIEDRNLAAVAPLISPRAVKARAAADRRRRRASCWQRAAPSATSCTAATAGAWSPSSARARSTTRTAARDYAARLKRVADATRDQLVVVMRTYFEKPRTTVGWKGLINDPHLDGSCDIPAGLEQARAHPARRSTALGLPCASELLDPVVPQYIADLLSWAAIGARTTESQTHREMASGLSMPVGFKNGTDGSLHVALNAMISARHPHHFVGINHDGAVSVIRTRGNPDRHIVLRGGAGRAQPPARTTSRAPRRWSPPRASRARSWSTARTTTRARTTRARRASAATRSPRCAPATSASWA